MKSSPDYFCQKLSPIHKNQNACLKLEVERVAQDLPDVFFKYFQSTFSMLIEKH